MIHHPHLVAIGTLNLKQVQAVDATQADLQANRDKQLLLSIGSIGAAHTVGLAYLPCRLPAAGGGPFSVCCGSCMGQGSTADI
jgi:hypothetical protein